MSTRREIKYTNTHSIAEIGMFYWEWTFATRQSHYREQSGDHYTACEELAKIKHKHRRAKYTSSSMCKYWR